MHCHPISREDTINMVKDAPKKSAEAKAPAKSDGPKRKTLTPEERVAKIEADLEAAKQKLVAKKNKAVDEATAKRTKLVERRDKLNVQIAELDSVIQASVEAQQDEAPEGDGS